MVKLNDIVECSAGVGTVVEISGTEGGAGATITTLRVCIDGGRHRRCGGFSRVQSVNPQTYKVIGQYRPGRAADWDLNPNNAWAFRQQR